MSHVLIDRLVDELVVIVERHVRVAQFVDQPVDQDMTHCVSPPGLGRPCS